MITTKIVLLGDTHPARLRGYGYSVQIFVDGEYIKSHQGWEDELKEIGKRHRKKP